MREREREEQRVEGIDQTEGPELGSRVSRFQTGITKNKRVLGSKGRRGSCGFGAKWVT